MEEQPYRPQLVNPLILLNVIVFAASYLMTQFAGVSLMDYGAKVNWQIADGQWYRLITPMFLHWDLYHIFSNMLGLYILGPHIEAIFGRRRFLAIYLLSGIGGVLLSFIFSDNVSAGASGAIFGLMGTHLYLFQRNRSAYTRIFGRDILFLIFLNIVLSVTNPRIDLWGHAGGLLVGVLAAAILGIRYDSRVKLRTTLSCFLAVAIGASGVVYSQHYRNTDHYYFFKALDLYHQGNVQMAQTVFDEGFQRFPQSELLKEVLKNSVTTP